MRVFMILPFVYAFNACGGDEPTFIGAHGESVYVNGFNVNKDEYNAEVKRVVDAWDLVAGATCDKKPWKLERLHVHFYELGMLPSPQLAGEYHPDIDGDIWEQLDGWDSGIDIGYKPKMRETALAHEFSHAILHRCGYEYNHASMYCWGKMKPEVIWVTYVDPKQVITRVWNEGEVQVWVVECNGVFPVSESWVPFIPKTPLAK